MEEGARGAGVGGEKKQGAMVLSAMAKGAAPPLSEKRPGCTTVSNSPQNHTRGRGRCFFAVSTGGGLESIFVEEGSTVWAHYEKEDYRMIAGEDDKWVNKCYKITKVQEIFKPNQKPTLINNSESEFYPAGGGGGGHGEKNVKRVANIAITSGCAAKNITYPSSHRASRSMSIAVFA